MTAPTVSAIVCCFTTRRWRLLAAAIASLRRQDPEPAEILVVVDHNPALLGMAQQAFEAVARVLANTGPRGLSGARNTGVAAAGGEVVAFLDDDAVAEPGWLAELVDGYCDPRVLGVGGHVEPEWQGGRPRWFPREFDWVVGCSHPGMRAGPVRNFIGANMSFRRAALTGTGGFRADLGRVGRTPAGCEETELCIRIAGAHPDAVLLYRPAAAVRHHVDPERATVAYFRARCHAEGRSKATVAGVAGTGPALDSERDYVRQVLPRGLAKAARSLLTERDPAGLARAAALVGGLAATGTGYLTGRLRARPAGPLAVAVLLVALAFWGLSLRTLTPDRLAAMTDLGLVSVLPRAYWMALGILVSGCAVLIHRRGTSEWVLAGYLAVVIIVLRATPAICYDSLRYSWAWKHVGIVDYVTRHGAVDPHIGTLSGYHAWPGFFTGNALLTEAGGVQSALTYAAWAPPVFALLALVPLRLLFGTLVTDRRQVWLGLLIFSLANWIGQEYFAPQSFAFLLYLIVLAVCLQWLPARHPAMDRSRWLRWLGGAVPGQRSLPSPGRRALLAVLILLMLALVSSHQLTPFMLLTALALLVAGRHTGPPWLPVLLAVLTAAWIGWMGREFLGPNLYWITDSFGRPAANAETFVDLDHVGVAQRVVNYADRALTAGVALLAALGWWRAGRTRGHRGVPALLAVSPLPLLAANNYGGEMLFRVYLFALPCLALLAAGVCYPAGRRAVPPVALTLALTALFCLAYYGKERMNYFTPDEVSASRWLYGHAPPGSLVIAATANFPWAFEHYETYRYEFLENLPAPRRVEVPRQPVAVVRNVVGHHEGPTFVVLTRSQDVSVRYTGVLPAHSVPALLNALTGALEFLVVYRNPDATIVELPAGGAG
jgi:hypothetical protein